MAQEEIKLWAAMLQEQNDAAKSHERACMMHESIAHANWQERVSNEDVDWEADASMLDGIDALKGGCRSLDCVADEQDPFEDDVIDPTACGFGQCNDEGRDDNSKCCNGGRCTITLQFDDSCAGGLQDFLQELLQKFNGTIEATPVKGSRCKFSGCKDDLQDMYAQYNGADSWGSLDECDKSEFAKKCIMPDGDTLAEADYREAVAHCLDPIGINASTADLVSHNTCALEVVKEGKEKEGGEQAKTSKGEDKPDEDVPLSEADLADMLDQAQLDKLDNLEAKLEQMVDTGKTRQSSKLKNTEDDFLYRGELQPVDPNDPESDFEYAKLSDDEILSKFKAQHHLTDSELKLFKQVWLDLGYSVQDMSNMLDSDIVYSLKLNKPKGAKHSFFGYGRAHSGLHVRDTEPIGKDFWTPTYTDVKEVPSFNGAIDVDDAMRHGMKRRREAAAQDELRRKEAPLPPRGKFDDDGRKGIWTDQEWHDLLKRGTEKEIEELYHDMLAMADNSGGSRETAFIKTLFGKPVRQADLDGEGATADKELSPEERKAAEKIRVQTAQYTRKLIDKIKNVVQYISNKWHLPQLMKQWEYMENVKNLPDDKFRALVDEFKASGALKPSDMPSRKVMFDIGVKMIINRLISGDMRIFNDFMKAWKDFGPVDRQDKKFYKDKGWEV